MRPHFECLQGMWTRTTRSYGENSYSSGKTKKGVWIWREVQKQAKLRVDDFKTMLETC